MNQKFNYFIKYVFLLIIFSGYIYSQHAFISINENSENIGQYEKFELTIELNKLYINPYDPAVISLKGLFKSPSGKLKVVDGFYYTDFTVSKTNPVKYSRGNDSWKIRFTPDETGTWTYFLRCTDSTGNAESANASFNCVPSGDNGFIRKSSTNYFRFDDGSDFFTIGENMCWYGRNKIFDYKKWIDDLADNGANFIRLWMCPWATSIEWKETGLGNYSKRQDRAYELDWIIDYAAEKRIYIMLCLNNHGQVSTYVNPDWRDNPYNIRNGGPCKNSEDFFSDSSAIKYYLRRLKYINARWGYSPNIFSWEFFNEIEWTDFYHIERKNIIDWQMLNAKFLDSIDVNHHLISTSYASWQLDNKMWSKPEIDFSQTHFYSGSPDIELIQTTAINKYLLNYKKPTIIGEFGLATRRQSPMELDPKGISFHNSLWASAVSGAFGTSLMWWWDFYLHPFGLYKYYKPLSNFISSVDFLNEDYKPYENISFESDSRSDMLIIPSYNYWDKSPANNFVIDSLGISPSVFELGSILFSNEFWFLGKRNPPSFEVNLNEPHEFRVVVGDTSFNSRINIKVDDIEKVNKPAEMDSTYSVIVPSGKHKILIDNNGEGWVRIAGIEINDFAGALRGFALVGKNGIIGWLHNKKYNWKYLKENGIPPAVTGKVKLGNLLNGIYQVDLIDCITGEIIESFNQTVGNYELIFNVNNLEWDYAFEIKRLNNEIQKQNVSDFELVQNDSKIFYLNTDKLKLKINKLSNIQISVENFLGQQVESFQQSFNILGYQKLDLDTKRQLHGLYFIKLKSPNNTRTIKCFFR